MDRYQHGLREEGGEPGSNGLVLANLLGIKDPREMEVEESLAFKDAYRWSLDHFSAETCFSFNDLCLMHRTWLGGIYGFAGKIRSVNLSKGEVFFAPAEHLQSSIRAFELILQSLTPCKSPSIEEAARPISTVHGEFILVHPFREGNGRLGRWLADLMAMQSGLSPIDWAFDVETESKRNAYHSALQEAFAKKFSSLEELVLNGLRRGSES